MRARSERRRAGLWLLAPVAGIGLISVLASPSALGAKSTSTTIGCGSNHAIAYDGTGQRRADQGSAPVSCELPTGFATQETHIAVTTGGTVVQEPAVVTPGLLGGAYIPGAPGPHPWQPTSPAGIAVLDTKSDNPTWQLELPGGSYWTGSDAALYADPDTGRLFEETLSPGSVPSGGQLAPQDQTPGGHATLLMSADNGTSWAYTPLTGFLYQENARYTSAPMVVARPAGSYPNATYWCGNRDVGLLEPLVLERECYRSLDGGSSWEMASILATSPVPQHSECGADRDDLNSLDGNYPVGAQDGSLYVMVSCTPASSPNGHNGRTFLARSTDQAGSFPILKDSAGPVTLPVKATDGRPELRVANVGTKENPVEVLYLAYQVGTKIVMKTATVPGYDASGTLTSPLQWSDEIVLTPSNVVPNPNGVTGIDRWALAVQGKKVAVSYVAQTSASGADRNGFISLTSDALATPAQMVIWTASVNTTRLLHGASTSAKDDFIDVTIAPDGRPWASFYSACSAQDPTAARSDPACEGAYANGAPINPINSNFEGGNDRGLVGSLRFEP